MSENIYQIYQANPATSMQSTDLYYLGRSPYGGTNDMAITWDNTMLSITKVGTVTTGTWNATVIGPTYGGTGVNNGSSTITIGGNVTFSGAFTFTGTVTANTSVTFPTSGTLLNNTLSSGNIYVGNGSNVATGVSMSGDGTLSNTGSLTVTGIGHITTGVLGLANGGTNANLTASNGGIVYSTASAMGILSGTATANQVLLSGSSTTPAWSTATYPATTTANQLLYSSATNTITGLTSANNGVLVTSNSGVPSILAGSGTSSQILVSNSAAAPSWSTATYPTTTTASQLLYSSATNTVAGLATANNGMLVTNNSGTPSISALGAGQIFIGTTSAAPTAASLTAGNGITITSASASITIASTGTVAWTDVTGTSQTMAANTGYIADNASLVTLTLPTTAAQGTIIEVAGNGAGGWTIAQNANQNIKIGSSTTTTGVGGSLSSTNRYDGITLLCTVANTTWVTRSVVGNLTVV